MPGLFFSNLVNKSAIENKINHAKNLLKSIENIEKEYFLTQLTARISDFEIELLSNDLNAFEKEQVLLQYDRFAKALVSCIEHPERTPQLIRYYHKPGYYPVGIHDREKPSILIQNTALATVGIGFALLASSIPAFVCNPALGAIFLSAAITLLFPNCFYLMTPESTNTLQKKEEEKELFESGAKLIKPDLDFNDAQQGLSNTSPSLGYSY